MSTEKQEITFYCKVNAVSSLKDENPTRDSQFLKIPCLVIVTNLSFYLSHLCCLSGRQKPSPGLQMSKTSKYQVGVA